jgi:hypothetical protein
VASLFGSLPPNNLAIPLRSPALRRREDSNMGKPPAEPGVVEVGLFFGAGALILPGGLLWTGLYGAPHHGVLGMIMVVGGMVLATIFAAALADD